MNVKYHISIEGSHRHFISFEARFQNDGNDKMRLCLPAWRPGRYELGNFSKNIRKWKVIDGKRDLPFSKITKDCWEVDCRGVEEFTLTYQYYAAELNAGSSYLDNDQLYINPVNCFFYVEGQLNLPYKLEFDLPEDYRIACGLHQVAKHEFTAYSFDELADCPLIASNSLRQIQYTSNQVKFNIWIQGDVKLDEPRLIREFQNFTDAHFELFGSIPCEEYHFLFHFPPYFIRHGVEHSNSTVIAMGPAADFQGESQFKDLLAISCHELFHTWNVKCIRPIEMKPYDFSKENYSRSGYVYEGVTTYYGDLLLWRTGSFSDAEWFAELEDRIQTYMDNHGRFNLSVAESSFDTWLDGYSAGIPWRKVSIYNEGLLIALLCDLGIIQNTSRQFSMDDVMRDLYSNFGRTGPGYSESDYRKIVAKYLGESTKIIFENLVNGTEDYYPFIQNALDLVGLQIAEIPSPKWSESTYGFSVDESGGKYVINQILPCSPADIAGLWISDEIITIDGVAPYKNFQTQLRLNEKKVSFQFLRKGVLMNTEVHATERIWGKRYKISMKEIVSDSERHNFNFWKSNRKVK